MVDGPMPTAHPVGNGVLDDGLQHEGRHPGGEGSRVVITHDAEPISEAVLLEPEVAIDEVELLLQADQAVVLS